MTFLNAPAAPRRRAPLSISAAVASLSPSLYPVPIRDPAPPAAGRPADRGTKRETRRHDPSSAYFGPTRSQPTQATHTPREHNECNGRACLPRTSAFCATERTGNYHPRRSGHYTRHAPLPSARRHVGTRRLCLLLLIAANGIPAMARPSQPAKSPTAMRSPIL